MKRPKLFQPPDWQLQKIKIANTLVENNKTIIEQNREIIKLLTKMNSNLNENGNLFRAGKDNVRKKHLD